MNLTEVLSQTQHLNRVITRYFLKAPIELKDQFFKHERFPDAVKEGDVRVVEMQCRVMFSEVKTTSSCTLTRRADFWEPTAFVLNVDTGSKWQSTTYRCRARRNPHYFVDFQIMSGVNVPKESRYVNRQEVLRRFTQSFTQYRLATNADIVPGRKLLSVGIYYDRQNYSSSIYGDDITIDENPIRNV